MATNEHSSVPHIQNTEFTAEDVINTTSSMSNDNYENASLSVNVNFNIRYLKFLAIWPLSENMQLWKRILLYIFFVFGFVVQVIICAVQIIEMVVKADELQELTDNIFMAGITFNGLFKQVYVTYRRRDFQRLVASMDTIFYKIQEPFINQKKAIIENSLLYGKIVTWSMSFFCISSGLCYPLIPLTAGFHSYTTSNISDTYATVARPLPHAGWFPFDKNKSPYYEVAYGIMSFNAIFIALYASSTDTLIISLIIHTFKQFDILQLLLRNLKEDAINQVKASNKKQINMCDICEKVDKVSLLMDSIDASEEEDYEFRFLAAKEWTREVNLELENCLKRCISKHQQLLEFSDFLNDLASPFLLEQLTVDVSFLCILSLHLTVVPVLSFKFASALGIVLSVLNIVALISWCSGELSHKSEGIGDAAFESDWLDASPHFKHSLRIIMVRAMRPCKITAGKFLTFNLSSYAAVLKASYSYFTVLQRVYHKD